MKELKLFEYVIKSHKHLYLYREVLIARDRHLNSEDCIFSKSALLTLVYWILLLFCHDFLVNSKYGKFRRYLSSVIVIRDKGSVTPY